MLNRRSNRFWGIVLGCVVAAGMCSAPGIAQAAPAVQVEDAGRSVDFTGAWKFLLANKTGADAPQPGRAIRRGGTRVCHMTGASVSTRCRGRTPTRARGSCRVVSAGIARRSRCPRRWRARRCRSSSTASTWIRRCISTAHFWVASVRLHRFRVRSRLAGAHRRYAERARGEGAQPGAEQPLVFLQRYLPRCPAGRDRAGACDASWCAGDDSGPGEHDQVRLRHDARRDHRCQ